MSAPKLYLILVSNGKVEEITTHRELDSAIDTWNQTDNCEKTGLVHCAFFRPQLPAHLDIPSVFKNKVLYSASIKWALPESYQSSAVTDAYISLNNQATPVYLAINQWGYVVSNEDMENIDSSDIVLESLKETISVAAQQVLKDGGNKPLNREEIYARIIESGYYHFNTPKPVHVLDVTLNREVLGTEYSKAAKTAVFGKTKEGRYFLLGDSSIEPQGWVCILAKDNPGLFAEIHAYGIFDERTYSITREALPESLSIRTDNQRYTILSQDISDEDPISLLKVAPQWLMNHHISDLGLTVRVSNVFISEGISKISELALMSLRDLIRFPNMGRKSLSDLSLSIKDKIKKYQENSEHDITNFNNNYEDEIKIHNEVSSLQFFDQVARLPLIKHVSRTLAELDEIDRLIMKCRLGYKGRVLTLEEVGQKVGVTRERIRQKQAKFVKKIISNESWDDVIGIRLGQLLLDRSVPLTLEILEIEDEWFEGFEGNYVYLSNIIEMFSENAINVINVLGRNVVTRISKKEMDDLVKDIREKLKQKSEEKCWKKWEVYQFIESSLAEYSSREIAPLLHEMFDEYLQFENEMNDGILVAYGKSIESAVSVVMAQAETPLHFEEVARRTEVILGRDVDQRRVHNLLNGDGIFLFDRGTFGLIDHCPLSESKRKNIRQIVEHMIYQGPINKQWHSRNIIEQLREKFPAIPEALDPYVLGMCIYDSNKLIFLGRMVWARSDSGMVWGDRVETADAFVEILEVEGRPLSGSELRRRLSEIREVADNMQIHGNERLIAVGPGIWGLSEWNLN